MNELVERNKEEVVDIVNNILDKGANYVIKSMPINAHIREILLDVKKVIKEKEFLQILKVALSSSLKEGAEVLGISENSLKEIGQVVDTAFKGGFTSAINIGIDIVGSASAIDGRMITSNFKLGALYKLMVELQRSACEKMGVKWKTLHEMNDNL